MVEKWISLEKNVGQVGSEGGVIQLDDELADLARITIEQKRSQLPPGDHYAITIGIYNMLVHTVFFRRWEDAIECANAMKIITQSLLKNTKLD
jgi:hypothetical protein